MNAEDCNEQTNTLAGYSAGFAWGFKSGSGTSTVQQMGGQHPVTSLVEDGNQHKYRCKRKYSSGRDNQEDMGRNVKHMANRGKHTILKRKANLSSNIQGQPLPIQRGLELMNKEQLQNALLDIMKACPQTQQLMNSKLLECNFSTEKCQDLLKIKLEQLYQSIPYSRSSEMNKLNDYAFVRMKPYILEFLNCLVDCILDQIPPRVENVLSSMKFLDLCTDMVANLPRFELTSNNYYYDKCLEQLSYIWCTLIEHIARDFFLTLNGESVICGWISKLEIYNELSNGILSRPLQLFKSLNSVDSNPLHKNTANTGSTTTPFHSPTNNSRLANDQ